MLCTIWCHLYNLKNVKDTHGEMLLLVKLQAKSCNFTNSNTPPFLFLSVYFENFFFEDVLALIKFQPILVQCFIPIPFYTISISFKGYRNKILG